MFVVFFCVTNCKLISLTVLLHYSHVKLQTKLKKWFLCHHSFNFKLKSMWIAVRNLVFREKQDINKRKSGFIWSIRNCQERRRSFKGRRNDYILNKDYEDFLWNNIYWWIVYNKATTESIWGQILLHADLPGSAYPYFFILFLISSTICLLSIGNTIRFNSLPFVNALCIMD